MVGSRILLAVALVVTIGVCADRHATASAGGPAVPAQSESAPSGPDRVYTDAQARRGEEVFTRSCGACHGEREFASRLFQTSWAGKTLHELFTKIKTTMPADLPGTLPEQEYLDVAAYVLRLNQFPAGDRELAADPAAMQKVKFKTEP